jgi:DNA-directed RNA polymerase specialized sigma54-like protein
MDSTLDVSSLIAQLKALKNHIPDDESKRKSLMEAARELVTALEAPGDTIQRIGYCVGHSLEDFFNGKAY